ncbi:hypothetical protein HW115_19115 [Verrucomicrobiaceae bacterium N1E253]|uniref:Uncharacterized protein n=1 Tax=Oceaniferula marina TaxID=2748318 RepID=A0A851GRT3_9BACT|nr:hypothetical protein [Oceaniferula marina]NWK57737.1 hypothetical protein [Oceaniferula marina]
MKDEMMQDREVIQLEDKVYKDILYRGGLVTFRIPLDWEEEYDPSGGGTFYKDVLGSGTLRLNVLSFRRGPNSDNKPFDDFEPYHDGLYIKTESKGVVERGVSCILFSWQIAYRVEGGAYRMAIFTYSIESERLGGDDAQAELGMINELIEGAQFSRAIGAGGDYYHK